MIEFKRTMRHIPALTEKDVPERVVEHRIDGFAIVASKEGVSVSGLSPTFKTENDLDDFAKAVADAWRDHLKLKPKLATPKGEKVCSSK